MLVIGFENALNANLQGRSNDMRSCKEIVRLVGSGAALTFGEQLEIRFHMMMCKHCSRYRKQLRIMRNSFKRLFKDLTSPALREQTELKEEIKRKIQASGKQTDE